MIDTISGAKASAIIYSIAETAKANNLKLYEYFEYLLSVIPELMERYRYKVSGRSAPMVGGASRKYSDNKF